jgi:formamidopyrimidine-DNA glycosylase
MPELPEVETIARQLAPLLIGRRVKRVEVLDAKLDQAALTSLQGCVIAGVFRHGKQVALRLTRARGKPAEHFLLVHLRMTGRLIWHDTAQPETKHLRTRFVLDQGCLLFFDPRRFGTLVLKPSLADDRAMGLDPLTPQFTKQALARLLTGSRQPLKTWLLRQDQLVGIGNIYASEILFAARLHPLRPAGSLSAEESSRLHRSVRGVLKLAVKHCGTTFSDFQDAHGMSGGFQRMLKAYGREGQPCKACGGTIVRLVQQQRSTFFCPECQPVSR